LVSKDKVTYQNSWVTDITISEHNVVDLVKGGRARWKIENETFNTLKSQGYHIEHNYGHGRQNLSLNFFLLNLLAFFMHEIFQLTDRLYQACRRKASARKAFLLYFAVRFKYRCFEIGSICSNVFTPRRNYMHRNLLNKIIGSFSPLSKVEEDTYFL
jgi:hypothetical protein